LLGTQPYTSVGRGQYLMEEAKKHLPRPGVDTPKLMYEKTDTLLNILGQMQDDLAKGQFKAPMGMGGKGKAAAPSSSNIVTMIAPNGQEKPVPADQVEHYKSLGARVK
jgi:hypothetical protein